MPIPGTCMSVQPQGLCLANPELIRMNSPLAAHWPRWHWALAGHPDNAFVRYVLGGLAEGFQVVFDNSRVLNSAARNMHSARLNAAVITVEVGEGRMFGPFRSPPYTSTAWGEGS